MSLELTYEHGYVVVDTQSWLEDRAERSDALTDEAREWLDAHDGDRYSDDPPYMTRWVRERFPGATGLYGEDGPVSGCTYNEDNYLSGDFGWVLFRHEGQTYLVTQPGIMAYATPTVWLSTADDDADLLSWASGYAGNAKCDCEWITESACILWPNGGGWTMRIADLPTDDDGHALCPNGHGPLTFWAD